MAVVHLVQGSLVDLGDDKSLLVSQVQYLLTVALSHSSEEV